MEKKPIISVPLGDASGIGPEIVVKSFFSSQLSSSRLVVVGDKSIVEQACAICRRDLTIRSIKSVDEAVFAPGTLNLFDLHNIEMSAFRFGTVSGMCGRAAYDYIERSIQLAMRREVDAVATPPINKESFRSGGIDYIGHTEVFGSLTGTADPLTMFEVHGLRVFFLTRHVSLRRALDAITEESIVGCVQRCTEALRRLGVTEGEMAVAGLNPHSGEHGLFGDEELREIVPAVEKLRAMGYRVAGPIGADSVFSQALHGKYNSVLSLYHDQGHIACKTLDFDKTIAITNGMPILRTSVDHGTAFDIAGRGVASEVSMIEAILAAEKYAPSFRVDSYS